MKLYRSINLKEIVDIFKGRGIVPQLWNAHEDSDVPTSWGSFWFIHKVHFDCPDGLVEIEWDGRIFNSEMRWRQEENTWDGTEWCEYAVPEVFIPTHVPNGAITNLIINKFVKFGDAKKRHHSVDTVVKENPGIDVWGAALEDDIFLSDYIMSIKDYGRAYTKAVEAMVNKRTMRALIRPCTTMRVETFLCRKCGHREVNYSEPYRSYWEWICPSCLNR